MRFFLRTAFGDSDDSYGGDDFLEKVFQGVCQGNGAGPAIWTAVSICLVILMHKQGHTNEITSALSKMVSILTGLLYVDNTDLL